MNLNEPKKKCRAERSCIYLNIDDFIEKKEHNKHTESVHAIMCQWFCILFAQNDDHLSKCLKSERKKV